jgi:hypothetical protein
MPRWSELDRDWSNIPEHLLWSIKAYVDRGRIPGELLQGIFSNELYMVVDSAADAVFATVPHIVAFMRLNMPPECYGSGERMAFWERVGGLEGLKEIANYGTRGDKFP